METGTKVSLLQLKKQLETVYPSKATIIGAGSAKSIKALNRRIRWGETVTLYQHDLRHVDVLVESLEFENGNTVQTPIDDDVKADNPVVRPRANQQVRISCGQMFVLQLGNSRHSSRRERVVPENVRSFTTQLHRIEALRSVLGRKEATDPSVRIRGDEFRV